MFKKKASSILAVALILGVLGVAAVAMAAPTVNGMSCSDPEKRQQMLDSHVKSGMMTQEQADQMKQKMDQMMNGGHSMEATETIRVRMATRQRSRQ